MSGTTLATVHWRALDREGEDKCRLAQLDSGLMLVGHARFRDVTGWAALDYVVRTGPDGSPTGADVTGEHGGTTVAWKLERHGGDWTFNDQPQPDLQEAEDLDLGFTPATHLLALRRLPQVGRLDTTAVALGLPGPRLHLLTQTYRRERGQIVHYSVRESGVDTQLAVDLAGFVTLCPGLWEAVDHG